VSNSNIIYKYRELNKTTIELLLNCELWCAKASSLNDPFDSQFNIEAFANSMNSALGVSEVNSGIAKRTKNAFDNFGICSFSKNNKNQVMWSHYAEQHYGLCIGFKEDDLTNENLNLSMMDVTYQEQLPEHGLFMKLPPTDTYLIATSIVDRNKFIQILTTKDQSWSYEEERRFLSSQFGAIKFSPKCIESIMFGLRMPERDKSTLVKLLSGAEWEHIKWFQAKKSQELFSIEFEEIKI
jgi:hypothetical protein